MDITPLYELKTRLRSAAISGTNLLSEDFRLKKAAENFKAMESASPVFKKIGELTSSLLLDDCPDKPGTFLDVITLADSVICTLGNTEISGEIEDISAAESKTELVNVPYSKLSVITDALTTSGSGKLEAVQDAWKESPKMFRDFRVMPALAKGMGASYAELADYVQTIVGKLGADMLPHLKKGFDPKGKKEMVRRIRAIEEINGANESEFFIEQLETAEKDVRTALIYALRHNEDNIDKLIELAKTEKGKPKTAALTALALFESDKPLPFFEEYSKKKTVEVLDIIKKAHSGWASRFTAQLIDSSLVDTNGNKITYSQITRDKVKLKNGADRWTFQSALWGKSGAEIEKIYREFDDPDFAPSLSLRLGETIAVTGDESLKKLAVELNTNSLMKGYFVYAEGTVRLISGEDCSEWIREQICIPYETLKNTEFEECEIVKLLRKITLHEGKYALSNGYYDDISEGWILNAPIPLDQTVSCKIRDIVMEFPCWQFDRVLNQWQRENDDEYRLKRINYYINHFVSAKGEAKHLVYLRELGAQNIKGIMRRYCETHSKNDYGSIRNLIIMLSGTDEYRLSETREIVGLMKSGKLKTALSEKEIDDLLLWSEKRHSN